WGIADAFAGGNGAFESSRHFVILYFRAQAGIGFCFFMALLETAVLLLLCNVFLFVRPAVFLCWGCLGYKAFYGFRCSFLALRIIGFRSLPFVLLHLALTLYILTVLTLYAIFLIAGRDRFSRGGDGFKDAVVSCLPYYLLSVVYVVLYVLILLIGGIFI
ncbi:MAG: hypothetical protein LBH24_00750, partial [Clostridiales bacterium]|nr:hypothetical protein [Clostridiales bacterium]